MRWATIVDGIRTIYLTQIIPDGSVGVAIRKAVIACAVDVLTEKYQHKSAILSSMEKLYASLDYRPIDRRLVVVRTNMGLCLQPRRDDECKR